MLQKFQAILVLDGMDAKCVLMFEIVNFKLVGINCNLSKTKWNGRDQIVISRARMGHSKLTKNINFRWRLFFDFTTYPFIAFQNNLHFNGKWEEMEIWRNEEQITYLKKDELS